ncbi:MAG: ATP-dependent Clp protease ATP-binding subunit, partial [Clostridia bacterium]|nr:ATP-dependent Clp protease ATP-binding subunit [Clostridia bacterium]
MQRTLCTRCKKNLAVVFVARVEGGETKNEGYCLKCARELGIGPINDLIRQMGISESDLENMSESLTAIAEESADLFPTAEDSEEGNNTATFPFLDKLFGARPPEGAPAEPAKGQAGQGEEKKEKSKHKFLDAYCTNLNRKAMSGQVDRIVGRSEEISRVIQILNRRQKNNPC